MNRKDSRRAEILDNSLQQIQEGKATLEDCLRAHPGAAADLRSLLGIAGRVHDSLAPAGPSPAYRKASEARLRRRLRELDRKSVRRERVSPVPLRGMWIRTAVAASVAAVVVVLGSGWGVTSASAQAIPGDVLYPVKQGLEEISLTFSVSAAGDAALLAKFADERLDEVQELIRKGREADLVSGLGEYEKTLNRLDAAMELLPVDSSPAQLEDVQARLARHASVLLNLKAQVPPAAQAGLERAIEQSQKSKDLVEKLRQGKGPDGVPPGQEKKSTQESAPGNSKPSSTKTSDQGTGSLTPLLETEQENDITPSLQETSNPRVKEKKATKTPKPTKIPKLAETPLPSETPMPSETPLPPEIPVPYGTPIPFKTPIPATTSAID